MRMRRKKHLEEKLAACDNLLLLPSVTQDYRILNSKKEYMDFFGYFQNENPLQMEIGCGKGRFICTLASQYPDVNFIAVEVNPNVLHSAASLAKEEGITNVLFLKCGAELLPKYVRPGTIERIYLNFSCPFPKKAYENRRLTNLRLLEVYKEVLSAGGEIHQKTDNAPFFAYSIEQYTLGGFKLKNVTLDLHNSGFAGNIETEYERRFAEMGLPIYRLEAYL